MTAKQRDEDDEDDEEAEEVEEEEEEVTSRILPAISVIEVIVSVSCFRDVEARLPRIELDIIDMPSATLN